MKEFLLAFILFLSTSNFFYAQIPGQVELQLNIKNIGFVSDTFEFDVSVIAEETVFLSDGILVFTYENDINLSEKGQIIVQPIPNSWDISTYTYPVFQVDIDSQELGVAWELNRNMVSNSLELLSSVEIALFRVKVLGLASGVNPNFSFFIDKIENEIFYWDTINLVSVPFHFKDVSTGHDELLSANKKLKIYPNPGKDQIKIESPDNFPFGPYSILIYSQNMQKVFSSENNFMGQRDIFFILPPIPKGIYFIELRTLNNRWISKWIRY